jgi:hypothetical protein
MATGGVTVTDDAVTVMSVGNAPAQALLGVGATGVGRVLGNIGHSLNDAGATGQAAVGQIAGNVGQTVNAAMARCARNLFDLMITPIGPLGDLAPVLAPVGR